MAENDLKILKTEFPDNNWKYLTKKIAYPYKYSNGLDGYQKQFKVENLKKKDFLSKVTNKCPDDEEIERTKQIVKRFYE